MKTTIDLHLLSFLICNFGLNNETNDNKNINIRMRPMTYCELNLLQTFSTKKKKKWWASKVLPLMTVFMFALEGN